MGKNRVDVLIRLLFGLFIFVGCALVLAPFLTSILLSAILTLVSWPLFVRARNSFGGHKTAAASLMVAAMVVTVLIPLFILCAALARQIPPVVYAMGDWVAGGMPVPNWIAQLPYIGPAVVEFLSNGLDIQTLETILQKTINPVSRYLLSFSLGVGNGLLQIVLVAFVAFFFYRDGERLSNYIGHVLNRVSGGIAQELRQILVNTTRSVVFGVVGTAIGQGVIAGIGFAIAGVPGVVLLSFLVCMLSIVPMGPPLVWIPAALWLYATGNTGMSIFLVLWGTLAVASVDNFIKPILISRGSTLSLGLVFLGVFGGILSFGLLGLVLGPVFLSAAIAMMQAWLKHDMAREQKELASATNTAESEVRQPATVHTVKRKSKRKVEAV